MSEYKKYNNNFTDVLHRCGRKNEKQDVGNKVPKRA
jgi:hypothetical protein